MKKVLTILLCLVLVLGFTSLVTGCQSGAQTPSAAPSVAATSAAPAATSAAPAKVEKIAFFVSDMSVVFHQQQVEVAKRYAKEKYGAEVFAFDGKGKGEVMTANIDQIVAQGMTMATLHVWDQEAAAPGIKAAIDKGVAINTFFSPNPQTNIPCVRSDEAGVAFQMGATMAKKWKEANPDKPIVMVELGWPNHTEVKSGRTDPFVAGVKSVDATATDLGCKDATDSDKAKAAILDIISANPGVNLIFSESSGVNVGTMAGLIEAKRGKMDNGKPLTEIVCSVDFDGVELGEVYDPNCSLKLSMGLPAVETAQARIDNLFAIRNGTIKQVDASAKPTFAKAYTISFWDMTREQSVTWLNDQFGLGLK